ncbi:hypothetical protein [Macrococcus equi]|uniref:hypothetical protein n=1 Tax=Macrococcus equi TaxID=3395462 RepID=UPI0039BE5E00
MLQGRKYVVIYRGKQYEGKFAQRIGRFAFADVRRFHLFNKMGISIRVRVS